METAAVSGSNKCNTQSTLAFQFEHSCLAVITKANELYSWEPFLLV